MIPPIHPTLGARQLPGNAMCRGKQADGGQQHGSTPPQGPSPLSAHCPAGDGSQQQRVASEDSGSMACVSARQRTGPRLALAPGWAEGLNQLALGPAAGPSCHSQPRPGSPCLIAPGPGTRKSAFACLWTRPPCRPRAEPSLPHRSASWPAAALTSHSCPLQHPPTHCPLSTVFLSHFIPPLSIPLDFASLNTTTTTHITTTHRHTDTIPHPPPTQHIATPPQPASPAQRTLPPRRSHGAPPDEVARRLRRATE